MLLPDAGESGRGAERCSRERGQEVLQAERSPCKGRCHQVPKKDALVKPARCAPASPQPLEASVGQLGGDGRVAGEPGTLRGHQQRGCPQALPIAGASTPLPALPRTGHSKAGHFPAPAARFLPAGSWFLTPSPCWSMKIGILLVDELVAPSKPVPRVGCGRRAGGTPVPSP